MSSPIPSAPYGSPAATLPVNANQALPGENFHPTVRVMRLYKPGFHLSATMPVFPPTDNKIFGSEFILSSHMLLPDSFGDIYLGEKFTAYVAIVNGFPQVPFHNVSLSVRLQTETTVTELQDTRPSNQIINPQQKASVFPILNCNDSCDVMIQHMLSELGTHTLRVSVQYSLFPGGEVKSMRKFYRFNVLLPLILVSSFREVNHKPMVQCQITNATKSPVFIDEMSFVPSEKYTEFVSLGKNPTNDNNKENTANSSSALVAATSPSSSSSATASTSIPLATYAEPLHLLPDESFAFAFQFTKYEELVGRIAGYPVVRWCSSMGESSLFRGDDTMIRSSQIPTALLTQPIKFILESCPATVHVGEEFEVSFRILNSTIAPWPLSIDCSSPLKASAADVVYHQGLLYVETVTMDLGHLEGGDFTDITMTVFAAAPGLYELPPIYAIHSVTRETYPSGYLCTVFVQNEDQENNNHYNSEAENTT